ncbi:hypothetical protein [Brevibacillus sp. 179-C9.3 HS]|uniref:hypothetical protein n=1 Tax=unclassified Brevibacillus TaxID=2684853 RepID=UPI0039A0BCA8
MNKKAIDALEKNIPPLLEKKRLLLAAGSEAEYQKEVRALADSFTNFQLRALEKYINILKENWFKLSEVVLSSWGESHADDSVLEERNLVEIKLEVLNKTVELKREEHKRNNYPVEKKLIDYGFFNSYVPSENDIPRLPLGGFEVKKNGYHQVTIKNSESKGSLLASYDTRILLSILYLWEVNGKQKTYSFYLKDLLKAAFLDASGGNYKKAKESIGNILSTTVRIDVYNQESVLDTELISGTGWYHPFEKGFVDDKTKMVYITLSETLQESLENGSFLGISMMLFHDLETEASKTLYINVLRLLQSGVRTIDAKVLADQIGVGDSKKSRAGKTIELALEELKERGVIGNYDILRDGRRTPKTIILGPPVEMPSVNLLDDEVTSYAQV